MKEIAENGVAIGYNAGSAVTTGTYNTMIGQSLTCEDDPREMQTESLRSWIQVCRPAVLPVESKELPWFYYHQNAALILVLIVMGIVLFLGVKYSRHKLPQKVKK